MTIHEELRHLRERVDSLERHVDLLTEAQYPGMVELATMEAFGRALMEHLKTLPPDERSMTDEQLDSAARRFAMRLRTMGEVPEKWSTVLANAMLSTQGGGNGSG